LNNYPFLIQPVQISEQVWANDIPPMVIVSCIAYNHKEYIEEAIQSFLSQKTTFRVEIWIHDDASTDGTTDIIRQYSEKFPDIIKPMLQKNNVHNQKVRIRPTYHFPVANSNYIALCDGDDFWIHPLKLQHQFTFMEAHPDYSVCYHNTYLKNNHESLQTFISQERNSGFTIPDVIRGLGGHTSSFFFRTALTEKLPAWVWSAPTLDYILRIHFAILGKSGYINKCLSVYRQNVQGSWNDLSKNRKSKIAHRTKMVKSLSSLNKDTNFEHDFEIQEQIIRSILKDITWFEGQLSSIIPLTDVLHVKNKLRLFKRIIFGILKIKLNRFFFYKTYSYLRNPLGLSLDMKWYLDCKSLPLTNDHKELYYNIHRIYFKSFRRFPDLKQCREFNEKMQWLKLFDQDEKIVTLSDKYLVRDFVKKMVGQQYLPTLYQVCNNFDDIRLEELPESFVMKTNNDCGTVLLVNNKADFIEWEARELLTKGLNRKFGWEYGDWAYKFIQPKIIIEEYLTDSINYSPDDYKFFVLNGEVTFVWYLYNRFQDIKYQLIDRNGHDVKNEYHLDFREYGTKFQKPPQWEEMISVAEKLAGSFKFIRVDLYLTNDRISFGELTFWTGSGLSKILKNLHLGALDNFDRSTSKPLVINSILQE